MTDTEAAVMSAADALIDAFARHDRQAYFDAFAPEATFVFYNLDRSLDNRAAYEAEWSLWEERDGFCVHACHSTYRKIQVLGDVAIFTHAVQTELALCGEKVTNRERETIVFSRASTGRWLAVHEHLSPIPPAEP